MGKKIMQVTHVEIYKPALSIMLRKRMFSLFNCSLSLFNREISSTVTSAHAIMNWQIHTTV